MSTPAPRPADGASRSDQLTPEEFRAAALEIEAAVGRLIVGQEEILRGVLTSMVAGGHVLLEGVPGLGKTTMARAFAQAVQLETRRVQFTPDLMPADLTGTTVLTQDDRGNADLRFQPGPVFTNLVLADEINRAAPRTQSALLEAMQEQTVTVGNVTHELPTPFLVLATQNPVEQAGTYPLPEAELDRFFMNLLFTFPGPDELTAMVRRTSAEVQPEVPVVADGPMLLRMRSLARSVPAATEVIHYASRLVMALHPEADDASDLVRECVRLGPSPRGVQALALAGQVTALLGGRSNLAYEDVRAVALPVLRHRLVLTFDAERRRVARDELVRDALERVAEEAPR
ncbi:MAG TPA: AAA family ATPase [Conexibacter sp.]|jgi:MoxR-like ATPase